MGLDIKIPIGAMFALLGIILTVFGIFTNGNEMYSISLDININLWSGLFMLVFGGIMLALSNLFKKKKNKLTL
jgi:amino acid transporter